MVSAVSTPVPPKVTPAPGKKLISTSVVADNVSGTACLVSCKIEHSNSFITGCTVNNVDVVFAVDTSSSVGEGNFNLTKTFLLKMMETLDFSNIRVGIIKFNDKVTTEFSLNENK